MALSFALYAPWMEDQVIAMFCEEYGNQPQQFRNYYTSFYSTYQANKAKRFVILDDQTVAGFVSFSYWPYKIDQEPVQSYQCGNVIINKNYRGKGLYNQLLNYINENSQEHGIDFIIGFPIKEILKLYLKSNWKNPMNLNWYVSVINPFGKLFAISELFLQKKFVTEKKHPSSKNSGRITLDVTPEFYVWNKAYNNLSQHFYYCVEAGTTFVEFGLKLNKRKYLNELVIGEINTNATDANVVKHAIGKLKAKCRWIPGISMLSCCLNDQHSNVVLIALKSKGFRKINRDIKFIVNPLNYPSTVICDPSAWELYRRDIDTW